MENPAQGHREHRGLRERHRQQVLTDLHEAAVAMVGQVGFAEATIDLIAHRAGVSRRTFFNYYASKEDAVLGATPPTVPETALSAYLDETGADQFTRTLRLIVAIIRSTYAASSSVAERSVLIDRYPQLRERMSQHVSAAESLTETALHEQLIHPGTQPRAGESSRALLMLASTVLRYAQANDPRALESADSAAIESAISVFRSALEELR